MKGKQESPKIEKHPTIVAWEKWENSPEGLECWAGKAEGQYLRNRLWRAFMAACKT